MPAKKETSPSTTSSSVDAPKVNDEFSNVLSTLSNFRTQITMLQNQIRSLEKTVRKNMKTLQKEAKKNRNKGNRKPSGFAVPTQISNEYAK